MENTKEGRKERKKENEVGEIRKQKIRVRKKQTNKQTDRHGRLSRPCAVCRGQTQDVE
jgi:hypothetical protein